MDRPEFVKERRQIAQDRMNTLFAPTYDEDWGSAISPSHREMLAKFLGLCPPDGLILDAACGTGKYFHAILESGRRVFGIDQAEAMLEKAQAKFPEVPLANIGMQEISVTGEYDAIICMDAMEYVSPEDWPLVLNNFHRALKQDGWLYLTSEIPGEGAVDEALKEGQVLGYPVVPGESVHKGGYHYYPTREQVQNWLAGAGFEIVEQSEGDEYWHLLTRRKNI